MNRSTVEEVIVMTRYCCCATNLHEARCISKRLETLEYFLEFISQMLHCKDFKLFPYYYGVHVM